MWVKAKVDGLINVSRKGVGLPPRDFVEIRASRAEAKAITEGANDASARPQPEVGVAEPVWEKGGVARYTLKVNHFFDQGSRNECTVEEGHVASTQQSGQSVGQPAVGFEEAVGPSAPYVGV